MAAGEEVVRVQPTPYIIGERCHRRRGRRPEPYEYCCAFRVGKFEHELCPFSILDQTACDHNAFGGHNVEGKLELLPAHQAPL